MIFDIELVETYGMATALRALRRPMNKPPHGNDKPGEDDLRLMRQLVTRGDDHTKFARMIGVGYTIRAPRYWWIEFSTYRVGVESVSESTMHRKMSSEFVSEDFEFGVDAAGLENLNFRRSLVHKGKAPLEYLKAELPEGFLQTRDIVSNYQALRHIYQGRKDHRLPHWRKFCEWIMELPYAEVFFE